MLSKERLMNLFIYSCKKKTRYFTKIYFYENIERFLAFDSSSQKTTSKMSR